MEDHYRHIKLESLDLYPHKSANTKKKRHSLSLKLVGCNNVSNRNHLVLIDWVKILRNVLWSKTHRLESHNTMKIHKQCSKGTHIYEKTKVLIYEHELTEYDLNPRKCTSTQYSTHTTHTYRRRVSHCVYVVLSDHNNPSVTEK